MSKYGQSKSVTTLPQEVHKEVEWSIRDTEFLLRLMMSSKIDGADIEVAASVISKVKDLHSKIVNHKVSI